jgi:hypothetical protein
MLSLTFELHNVETRIGPPPSESFRSRLRGLPSMPPWQNGDVRMHAAGGATACTLRVAPPGRPGAQTSTHTHPGKGCHRTHRERHRQFGDVSSCVIAGVSPPGVTVTSDVIVLPECVLDPLRAMRKLLVGYLGRSFENTSGG